MSILVSQHFYAKLSSDSEIKKKVGTRFFPIAAITETRFPFIVYERAELTTVRTKDGFLEYDAIENVYILCETYQESASIAQMVEKTMNYSKGKYEGFEVRECIMIGASESYEEGVFVQLLNFKIKTE